MGDLRVRLPHQNGVLVGQNAPQLPPPGSNPFPSDIPRENWQVAEEVTQLIIWRIQPTKVSERRRRVVVDYVQRLIRETLGSEVFPFGSVPLKTYLPDGDIDLTAVCLPNTEENLACDVRGVLECEEQNYTAEFEVKDVQYINAEVKLVKCLVQNIVVDVSFNQIGGLCTLCFLEKVDRKIGKTNLFKRSIILIKAWCYYESRILGAHHALISTYALETLVLYIFHLFHSSLNGPLEVLYIFLDYFSKFDWDNFCVSLRGPVDVSSLPEIVVARSEQTESDHLLSKEFLDECVEKFSIPPKIADNNSRSFVKKHLNIVDPLKESNNLGRSVSKGNFHRIRGAFTYGARKLGKILSSSKEDITNELNKFFTNTLERHGNGERPDVRDIDTYNSGVPHVENSSHNSTNESTATDTVESYQTMESETQAHKFLQNGCTISRRKHVDEISVSGERLNQEVNDPLDAGFSDLKIANGGEESSCQVTNRTRSAFQPNKEIVQGQSDELLPIRPRIYESPMKESEFESYCRPDRTDFIKVQRPYGSRTAVAATSNGGTTEPSSRHTERNDISDSSIAQTSSPTSNVYLDVNGLSELSGDHVAQAEDLSNAKMLYRSFLSGTIPRNILSPRYRGGYQWDFFPHPNVYPHVNGVISGPFPYDPNYYINLPFMANSNGKEDLPRPRGTGIFFPNTHNYQQSFKDKPSHGRGRNPLSTQAPKQRYNGRPVTPLPPEHTDKGEYAPEFVLSPVSRGNSRVMPGKLESPRASPISTKASSESSDIKSYHVEFGTFGPIPLDVSLVELGKTPEANNLNCHSSTASTRLPDVQKSQQSMNKERSEQFFHLKDEGDFPPLLGQGQPTTSTQPKLHKTAWGSRSRSSIS